jgi:hypothetical protein
MAGGLFLAFLCSLAIGFLISSKIGRLVKLIKVINKCLDQMRGESMIAIFMFFVLLGYYSFAVETFILLLSSGNTVADNSHPIFIKYARNSLDKALIAYFLIGFVIINNFIHNLFYMVYCILCSLWYFNNKNGNSYIDSPIRHAFGQALFNHPGSIVKASIVLPLALPIRGILWPLRMFSCVKRFYDEHLGFYEQVAFCRVYLSCEPFTEAAKH